MNINTEKTPSPVSGGPGTMKSTLVTAVKAAFSKPLKTEKTATCQTQIETKAYEIWMSRGQEQGHDQEHWFEAKRQLQRA